MKKVLFNILLLVTLYSCNSNGDDQPAIVTMDPKDIQSGGIIHDSLTAGQIEKITKIQSTFSEVYPISLEETILNFKKDLDVDREIVIWLNMGTAYEKYLATRQGKLDLNTKTEVFSLILTRSMMSAEDVMKTKKLKILSEKDAKEVMSFYSEKPIPIGVMEK